MRGPEDVVNQARDGATLEQVKAWMEEAGVTDWLHLCEAAVFMGALDRAAEAERAGDEAAVAARATAEAEAEAALAAAQREAEKALVDTRALFNQLRCAFQQASS